ncbi:MAG TPA: hypothetical protein VJR58_27940 [Vineibacter sp.]|nr:hypothetical protein [Vineibacter sp.]
MKAILISALAVVIGVAVAVASVRFGGRWGGLAVMAVIAVALLWRPRRF